MEIDEDFELLEDVVLYPTHSLAVMPTAPPARQTLVVKDDWSVAVVDVAVASTCIITNKKTNIHNEKREKAIYSSSGSDGLRCSGGDSSDHNRCEKRQHLRMHERAYAAHENQRAMRSSLVVQELVVVVEGDGLCMHTLLTSTAAPAWALVMTWLPHKLTKLAYDFHVGELVAVGTDWNPVEPSTSLVLRAYHRACHHQSPASVVGRGANTPQSSSSAFTTTESHTHTNTRTTDRGARDAARQHSHTHTHTCGQVGTGWLPQRNKLHAP